MNKRLQQVASKLRRQSGVSRVEVNEFSSGAASLTVWFGDRCFGLDSNPNQPIDAYVSRIDPQATFTPENTYFRDERVKQVVGVKLQLKGGQGFAKPGMPADGEILVQGDAWPETSRRK